MSELLNHTLAQALDGMAKGEFTATELTKAYIDQMAATKDLNAYITETPDIALEMAKASDERRAKGQVGLMEGIPTGIKDLFCTEGTRTTAASKILETFTPTYESTTTGKLFYQGAVMLGKTNLDQFAMGSSNQTSAYGDVINPWQRADGAALAPGGSSGGSAAAVAAKSALATTGTDTGGSIRQPASFCGITGMKPTYGRCSRWGVVAFASSLDQPGTFARDVTDNAIMLQAMAGYDDKDSTSIDLPVPNYREQITGDIRGKKIGIPKEYVVDGMPAEIEKLWQQGMDWLRDAGAEIVDISLPLTDKALPVYYIVAPAEASSNLARYDGVRYGLRVEGEDLDDMYAKTRGAGFGDEVKRRILIGTYVLSAGYYDAYYNKARRVRKMILNEFLAAYNQVDAILTPTCPSAAFALAEAPTDPVTMYLNDVFTVPASLAGLPGISVPAGLSGEGLPLGLQILGKPFEEGEVLNIASVVEKAAGFRGL